MAWVLLDVLPAKVFTSDYWISFWRRTSDRFLSSVMQIVGILLVYVILRVVLYRLIDGVLARLMARETRLGASEERAGRLQIISGLCKSMLSYLLFFVFGVQLLQAVGYEIGPILTTAGVLGVAVGFGSQKLVKDVISGFFIIVDNQFVVGDTVTIGMASGQTMVTGQVQEMGMRVTRIQDATGKLHMFANGDIGLITNLSRHPVEDYIEVNVGAAADLNKVIAAIQKTGETLFAQDGHHLKAAPHVLGTTAFSAASITLRVAVVSDPRYLPEEQMHVRAAIREALLAAEIPLA